MWTYYPDLLATPVPRYTSYPTAAEFSDIVGPADMMAALDAVGQEDPVSLYIHIPYCQDICWYCGCNTGSANRPQRLAAYLEALEGEIALVGQRLGGRGRIERIAFGGGSPNAIAPIDFIRLLQQVTICFRASAPDISVELDPRTVDDSWIETLGAVGAARASLGVQTFAPAVQRAIGRVQPYAVIDRVVAGLRRAGVASVGFDLMYGLPEQGMVDLTETIDAAIHLRPERIALFGYAHVPHLLPRQRRIDAQNLPDAQTRFAMASEGFDRFTQAGYQPVGFDHFALPGDPLAQAAQSGRLHRNFQGFTEDSAPVLIGLGASAISRFPDRIVQNEKNVGRYRMRISGGQLPAERGIALNADDRIRGAVIESLLCRGSAEIGDDLAGDAAARLRSFEERQLIVWERGTLRISDAGRPYARSIAAAFDTYRQPSARRFSSAI